MCKDVRYFTFFEFFYKLALHTTTCTHTVQFRSHDSQSHQSWRHSIPTSSSQQRENIDEVLNVVIWVLSKHGLRPQSNVCGLSYTWLLMNSSRQHSVGSRPRLGVWTQPRLCMIDFSLRLNGGGFNALHRARCELATANAQQLARKSALNLATTSLILWTGS